MNKRILRIAISLLCVMTLLFTSVLTFTIPATAQAVTIPTPVGELTWSDFGIVPSKSYIDSGWLYGGIGFTPEDYKFTGKVKLANNAAVQYAVGELGHAFRITQNGSALVLGMSSGGTLTGVNGEATSFSAADLGFSAPLADTEFALSIQVWSVPDDLKSGRIAVWVNENLLGVYDAVITHSAMKFGQYAAIYDTSKTSTATSYAPIPTDLTTLSWADFSRSGTAASANSALIYTGSSFTYTAGAFNNVLFNGDIVFPSYNDSKVILFGGWHGVYLDPAGATLKVSVAGTIKLSGGTKTLYASDYGLESFDDTRFNLKVAVTGNTDGTSATVRFWFNDQIAFSTILTASGAERINGSILPYCAGGAGGDPSIVACHPDKKVPNTLQVISWTDFSNMTYDTPLATGTNGTLQVNGGTMNNTILDGDILIPTAGAVMTIASTREVSHGLLIQTESNGTMRFSTNIGTGSLSVHPRGFGLTSFVNERFNLKIKTTNVANFKADIEIWINDRFAGAFTIAMTAYMTNGEYGQRYYVYGQTPTLYASTMPIPGTDGSIPTDVTPFTWKDTANLTDGTFAAVTSGFYKSHIAQIDDALLQGYATFAGSEALNLFGPLDNYAWGGIKVRPSVNENNILTIDGSHAVSGLTLNIPASKVKAISFVNEKFLLQVSVQYVDYDGDGAEDDLKLGIWVNGVNAFAADTLGTSGAINGFKFVVDHATSHSHGVLTGGMMAGQEGIGVTLESYMPVPNHLTEVNWEDLLPSNATNPLNVGETVPYHGSSYFYNVPVNNTIFNGDIQFAEASPSNYIRWFGGSSLWQGADLKVVPNGSSNQFKITTAGFKFMRGSNEVGLTFDPNAFGLNSFLERFNLKMAITNLAADTLSADLHIWINDIYAGWATMTATGVHTIGNKLVPANEVSGVGGAVFTPYAATYPVPEKPDDGLAYDKPLTLTLDTELSEKSEDLTLVLTPSTGIAGILNTATYSGLSVLIGDTTLIPTFTKDEYGKLKTVISASDLPTGEYTVTVKSGLLTATDDSITYYLKKDVAAYVNANGIGASQYVTCVKNTAAVAGGTASSLTFTVADSAISGTLTARGEDSGVFVNGTRVKATVAKSGTTVTVTLAKAIAADDTVMLAGMWSVGDKQLSVDTVAAKWNGSSYAEQTGDLVFDFVKSVVDSSYTLEGTVTVNGTAYSSGTALYKAGSYTVVRTIGNRTVTIHLQLYREGDLNGDDTINACDLVLQKRYEADNTLAIVAAALTGKTALRKDILAATKADASLPTDMIGETGADTFITSVTDTNAGTVVIGMADSNNGYAPDTASFNDFGLDYVIDLNVDRPIKILQLTDTQIIDAAQERTPDRLGASSDAAWATDQMDKVLFDCLRATVEEAKPDLIIMTGDNVYGEFDDAGTSYTKLVEVMESLQIPWAPVYGNHDNESRMGVEWQNALLADATYCLFVPRHDIGGNGNYSIGVAKNGELQRVVYMMDTNYCNASEESADLIKKSLGFTNEQKAWILNLGLRVNTVAGKTIPSIVGYHVQNHEVWLGAIAAGYEDGLADLATIQYTLGKNVEAQPGDSGFKRERHNGYKEEGWLEILQTIGADGTFFGHQHVNSLSVMYGGIRWTYGLKTGAYDASPAEQGGTLITLSDDGSAFALTQIIVTQ